MKEGKKCLRHKHKKREKEHRTAIKVKENKGLKIFGLEII